MANNFTKNFTEKVLRITLEHFRHERVVSKTVNNQLLEGEFDADSGDRVLLKRPTDDVVIETSDGDISSSSDSPFITGTAFGETQDYITVYKRVSEADQALKFGSDSERFYGSIARRIATTLDLNFAKFAYRNSGLLAGTFGTPVTTWSHVSDAASLLDSTGVPDGDRHYLVNPFTQNSLASERLTFGTNPQVTDAEKGLLYRDAAGFDVRKTTGIPTYTTGTGSRTGTLAATPDGTYVTAKDTMTQSISVSGFGANLEVKAGEQIRITGRNRLNLATREPVIDDTASKVEFTATVVSDATLDGTGGGTLTITGPGIFEATGAYNTVDSALTSGDVVTLLGLADTLYQGNMFYHRDAFGIGYAPMERLSATDSFVRTEDGIQMRVSMDSEFLANKNLMRFDIRPIFGVFNPFFAGISYGS